MTRVDENKVRFEILKLLENGRVWTNAQIKSALEKTLPLSAEDKAQAEERQNEPKWHSIVNNALSPSRRQSLQASGAVASKGRGEHQITESGRKLLAHLRQQDAMFDELFSDVEASDTTR